MIIKVSNDLENKKSEHVNTYKTLKEPKHL
jgi:hypothetical protein